MEETGKISASQLFLLLLLSHSFSLASRSPMGEGGRLTLPAALLSGLTQAALLLAGLYLCRRKTGASPFPALGTGFYRVQNLLYWGCCMTAAVCTVVDFVSFMTAVVYDYREGWMVAVTFGLAGALAACQGLEGLARGGGVLAVLLGLGFVAVALGLWREYDWLNLSAARLSLGDTMGMACYDAAQNSELFALLLLLPCLRKAPRSVSCAGWVGCLTFIAAALRLMTVLTLGSYGGMKPFPVFTAMTSMGFWSFHRLDSVLLAVWVTLGLMRLAVFLSLAARCFSGVFFRPMGKGWVWGSAALAAAGALALWSGPESWSEHFYRWPVTGAVTLLGVLFLPLAGKLADGKGEQR